jgi:RNA polymerase-binding transcription factor DksA
LAATFTCLPRAGAQVKFAVHAQPLDLAEATPAEAPKPAPAAKALPSDHPILHLTNGDFATGELVDKVMAVDDANDPYGSGAPLNQFTLPSGGEERDEVRARLASMTKDLESLFAASVDSNADDEHDPEGQTIAYERSQLSALIQGAQAHLASIGAATIRLQRGSYGICEVCDQPIPAARLEARPTARTCVRHAAARRG